MEFPRAVLVDSHILHQRGTVYIPHHFWYCAVLTDYTRISPGVVIFVITVTIHQERKRLYVPYSKIHNTSPNTVHRVI